MCPHRSHPLREKEGKKRPSCPVTDSALHATKGETRTATSGTKLSDLTLSDISQAEEDKCRTIPLLWSTSNSPMRGLREWNGGRLGLGGGEVADQRPVGITEARPRDPAVWHRTCSRRARSPPRHLGSGTARAGFFGSETKWTNCGEARLRSEDVWF